MAKNKVKKAEEEEIEVYDNRVYKQRIKIIAESGSTVIVKQYGIPNNNPPKPPSGGG